MMIHAYEDRLANLGKQQGKEYQRSFARRYETSVLSFFDHVCSYPIFHTANQHNVL